MNQEIISIKNKEIQDNVRLTIAVKKDLFRKFDDDELTEMDIRNALLKLRKANYEIGYNDGEKNVYDIYPNEYKAE